MTEVEKAKSVSITDYLLSVGFSPSRENKARAMYASPIRSETDPSFVVHKIKNMWYDYGPRVGGDVIDLVMAYEQVNFKRAVQVLTGQSDHLRKYDPKDYEHVQENTIIVDCVGSINSPALLSYLQERCIDINIAQRHCVQVKWQFSSNRASWNYGIGFRNDSGGLEIRTKDFKVGTSPKTYRTIGQYTPECNVFEGFFDYLSVLTQYRVDDLKNQTYVLNSLAFVHILIGPLHGYDAVNTFFDNDAAGNHKTDVLRDEGVNVVDKSFIYAQFNDYNEYWKHKCR